MHGPALRGVLIWHIPKAHLKHISKASTLNLEFSWTGSRIWKKQSGLSRPASWHNIDTSCTAEKNINYRKFYAFDMYANVMQNAEPIMNAHSERHDPLGAAIVAIFIRVLLVSLLQGAEQRNFG